ncbi:gluconate 2-dehydrogenase subunit 3 family protein [Seonamhaeicola marinus]|uniref:Gluconate 2-dehydrogenase subunit 3 family protein n=1 Tax=Seonamhaeicola marinus TaxID=1912246 RepID=A0A5D0HTZ1_9FLAO|nr:gluconate 2-dehydrogenase subunit 3 family protein [Seonamhaeicola marinus]TYA74778.1 gluconate 2-dehydrogenase subunit 3 family protein [Seonamhaeicola marinus]
MDRRTALKNLTADIGYTVATPTILSILSSCKNDEQTWTPLFLSEDEKYMVTHLSDIILPKTELPGAIDVNIPQFIDLMYNDVETDENKKIFKKGAQLFAEKSQKSLNKSISDISKEDFNVLLDAYFNVSVEESKKIVNQLKKNVKNIPEAKLDTYHIYKFLYSIRQYTIFGYCTSEEVGENVLAYDPVPGAQLGCISTDETNGRAWSL